MYVEQINGAASRTDELETLLLFIICLVNKFTCKEDNIEKLEKNPKEHIITPALISIWYKLSFF